MFGWFVKVDEEKRLRVRKRCRLDMSAFVNCRRAYSTPSAAPPTEEAGKACDTLRSQVLHCYSSQYCEEESKAYERCYHSAVSKGRYYDNMKTMERSCRDQVRRMERCLKRQRVLPEELRK